MPTVLVAGPSAMQNSLFLPQRDNQAELAWVAQLNTNLTVNLRMVTHLSTNLARRKVTLIVHSMLLPLCQTASIYLMHALKK